MLRSLFTAAALLCAATLFAEDPTRALQSELKEQGFYYGEIDGISGPALSAALRRYQIRNGLEVTGTATEETMQALRPGTAVARTTPAPAPAPERPTASAPMARQPVAPLTQAKPPVDLRKKQALIESDQRALEEESQSAVRRVPRDRSVVDAPVDLYRPAPPQMNPRYRDLYAGSPYASAPPPLQEQTLRAAQRALAREGFYNGAADGQPGPATEDALLAFQAASRLPRTGRLDMETLSVLNLLPGAHTANPVLKPFTAPPRMPRTYRGIWVD